MQACNFPEKRTRWQVFSCESCETLKNIFFVEHLRATASEQTWNFMWCYSWLSETGHPTQWHIQTYWLSCICTIVTWNTFIRRTYVFLINYTLKDPTNIYMCWFSSGLHAKCFEASWISQLLEAAVHSCSID